MKQEEFDRSKCFTFFRDFHEQIILVKEEYGLEKAFGVYEAIVNYGLYGIEPKDRKLQILMGKSTLATIENSQEKRERCFAREDMEMSRSIILLHCDRPDLSQNQIAQALKTSKGKVNKTLQKYRNGEYEGILDLSDNSNTNSHSNANTDAYANTYMTATVTEPVTGSASADHPGEPQSKLQPTANSDEIPESTMETIYDLFKQGKKYKEMSDETGLTFDQIKSIIDDGIKHKFTVPSERPEYIPQYDGQLTAYTIDDFNLDPDDLDIYYHSLTNQQGEYKFDVSYVDQWFERKYGYKAS